MHAVELIRAKRDGEVLNAQDISDFVKDYTAGNVPDYQMSAFLMAVFFRSMVPEELAAWTEAMLHSGQVIDLSDIAGYKVDKHSTGGVGDKVSLVLAPLAVAAGLKVPMISGRGLGHTGGTLDKLESIPGFRVDLSVEAYRAQVDDLGCALIGQTAQVAPADRKLYALRDVTGTIECIPLIASSIMSKKLAEGIDALVLDVKVGSGAFMKDRAQARELAETMIAIGKAMGKPVRALMTDMDQPLGHAVGNALEVAECIDVMRGQGPADLSELCIELVYEMLDVVGQVSERNATKRMLRELLEDGSALQVFRRIIAAQGGDPRVCDEPQAVLPKARYTATLLAASDGVLEGFDTEAIGHAALDLGAGRRVKEDTIDPAVGLELHKKRGSRVKPQDVLCTIHYNDESKLEASRVRLQKAISIGNGAGISEHPLVLDRL